MAFKNPFKRQFIGRRLENMVMFSNGSGRQINRVSNPTALACINNIASTAGNLPIQLMSYVPGGKTLGPIEHPYSKLLRNPNSDEGMTLFNITMFRQMLTYGNAFIKETKLNSRVVWTLCDPVSISVDKKSGITRVSLDGVYDPSIFIVPYPFTYNGITGVAPHEVIKEAIDLDNALIVYLKAQFENSLGKRVAFKIGKDLMNLDDEKFLAKIQPMADKMLNALNAGTNFTFPEGFEKVDIDQTANALNDLSSLKKLTEQLICQSYMFPYSIYTEENKYNSLEARSINYKEQTIHPLWDCTLEVFNKRLPETDTNLFFDVDFDYMLTTDTKTKNEILKSQQVIGSLTPDEFRKEFGRPPLPNHAGENPIVLMTKVISLDGSQNQEEQK